MLKITVHGVKGEKMRLIDADTLRKDVEKDRDASDMPKMWYQGVEYAINHIIHAPTVDPVKHGHWDNKIIDARFDVPHTVARCSNCKGKIWVYAENYVVKYPYCPLCGAKMDEVTDGSSDN